MSNYDLARLYFLGEDSEYLNEIQDELTDRGFSESKIEELLKKLDLIIKNFIDL